MRVSELIRKLEPFAKADEHEEPVILVAVPGRPMPDVLDTVKIWEVNGVAYLLLFKDPEIRAR
jgi:hypothetical protein